MKELLYDFNPPETFRMAWASEDARLEFQDKITRLAVSFQAAEFLTVIFGKRRGGIFIRDFSDLQRDSLFCQNLEEHNLVYQILDYVPKSQVYANAVTPVSDMNDAQVRILIKSANEPSNNINLLLGYPGCCVQFFEEIWEKEGYRDTIPFQYTLMKNHHRYCNVMLKGLGIRAVPHLPCSPYCQKTIDFAKKFLVYLSTEEQMLLERLLAMEMEYSSYHGYAEVKTKYFKLLFNSIAFKEKFVIHLPEVNTVPLLVRNSEDNGFYNLESQDSAHGWLLEKVTKYAKSGSLVDLGCGDGTLLQKLGETTDLRLSGVDISLEKCTKAQVNLGPEVLISCKNIFLYDFIQKDYILIAEQRLEEFPDFLNRLNGIVLRYNYSTRKFVVIDNRKYSPVGQLVREEAKQLEFLRSFYESKGIEP